MTNKLKLVKTTHTNTHKKKPNLNQQS